MVPSRTPRRAVSDPRLAVLAEESGYEIQGRIDAGGMGVVYRAQDADGQDVAIKLLRHDIADDARARERLAREVTAQQRVRNDNIARILDAELDSADAFVVTEFIPGPTLEQAVRDHGGLHPEAVREIGLVMGATLQEIHAAGVIHRDLKPGNVMLRGATEQDLTGFDPDGDRLDPVIIDFGIAIAAEESRLTSTGLVMGTAAYLDPEVIRTDHTGEAGDWWAWAALLAFAATGREPYGTGRADFVFLRAERGEIDVEGAPTELAAWLRSALRSDPAQRPAPTELMERLADLDLTVYDDPGETELLRTGGRTAVLPVGGVAAGTNDTRQEPVRERAGSTPADDASATQVLPTLATPSEPETLVLPVAATPADPPTEVLPVTGPPTQVMPVVPQHPHPAQPTQPARSGPSPTGPYQAGPYQTSPYPGQHPHGAAQAQVARQGVPAQGPRPQGPVRGAGPAPWPDGQGGPGQQVQGGSMPGQATPGQMIPGQPTTGQVMPGQGMWPAPPPRRPLLVWLGHLLIVSLAAIAPYVSLAALLLLGALASTWERSHRAVTAQRMRGATGSGPAWGAGLAAPFRFLAGLLEIALQALLPLILGLLVGVAVDAGWTLLQGAAPPDAVPFALAMAITLLITWVGLGGTTTRNGAHRMLDAAAPDRMWGAVVLVLLVLLLGAVAFTLLARQGMVDYFPFPSGPRLEDLAIWRR